MKRIIRFSVPLVLSILSLCLAAVLAADAAHGAHRPRGHASLRMRNLLEEEASTVIYTVDFKDLATRNVTGGNLQFKTQEVQYGAYDLSAEMVSDLNTMVVEQLKDVPPQQSQVLGPIQFPGTQMDGQSVLKAKGTQQPLRIPTVYAPFQSGTVFDFGPNIRGEGPGVALHLSNITLVLPNVTYNELSTSGFTNFFKFRENARVCISNSMLVFKACEGFLENTFHMLCCTASHCNIQYSKDALTHLGYQHVASTLGFLTCHDTRPRPALTGEPPTDGKKPNVTLISAVTVVVGVVLFCAVMTGLIMRCASKKTSSGNLLPFTKAAAVPPSKEVSTEQQSAPTKREKRPPPKPSALTEKALKEEKDEEIVHSQTTASPTLEGHSGGLPPKLLYASRLTSPLTPEESPVRASNVSQNDLERGSDRVRSPKGGEQESQRLQLKGISPTRGRSPTAHRHGVSASRGASPAGRPLEQEGSPRHRGASPEKLRVHLEAARGMLSVQEGRTHEARSTRVGCSKGSAGARKSRSSMGSGKTASVPEGLAGQDGAARPKHGTSAPLGVEYDSFDIAGDSQLQLLDAGGVASDFAPRPQPAIVNQTTAGDSNRPKTVHSRPNCVAPLPAGASLDEKRAAAERQLDALGPGKIVLDRFVLLDAGDRVHGGQAVVQFAYGKLDKQDYAIKFFLSRKAYEAEEALYRHTTLGQFLPHVIASCPEAACSIRDPSGRPLPACMVMEKGEALDMWMERAQPDKYMAFSMIANLAERVCDLHARGWVHRDLKPGNVMWLPRTNRWTVIDFGCAAPCGILAPLSFTLGYAPPEVAIAIANGRETIKSHFSMDAWSVGVIAFELLTGQSAFKMFRGREDVMNQLVGTADLPWEGRRLTSEVLRKLGAHRKDVLGLLHRDPKQRLSLYEFLNSCSRVLQ